MGDVDPHGRACVKRMADCMRHRGPDDEGFFDEPPVFLGHRRLSVVDLSTGHQPISNEDATVWTAYNGEIYNYLSLRSQLEKKGHSFRTHSDTECIVHLYEDAGADFPKQLNGMFAIALWDCARKTLVLARDRLGIKPVYYARLADGTLAFASEIRALLRCPGVDTNIDPVALDSYLALQYIPGPRTIYRGVHKLPAGHTLVANAGGIVVKPFWTLEPAPPPSSFEEACDEFRALFEDAVRIQLMSDVPLGAFLSGGIDSGLVVAAMAKAMDRPVRTFSIGFDAEGGYSELPYAAVVARHFGTQHETLTVSALDLESLLPQVAVALDEPLADPAAVPTYLLSRFAREHVTVALTGEGADELFAGYDRYRLEALRNRIDLIPAGLRRGAIAVASPLAGGRARKALQAAAMDAASGFVHLRSVMPREMRRALLRADVAAQVPSDHLERRMAAYFQKSKGLDAALRADTLEWLPDDLLMKVDKTSMLASLEARVPFLDYRIVERVSGYPVGWKYRNGRSKVLLKAVAEKVLPREIVHRPKHGFAPPIGRWLRGSLRAYLETNLLDSSALSSRWLEPRAVRDVVGRYMNGEERLALPVWALLCLEIWMRNRDGAETPLS